MDPKKQLNIRPASVLVTFGRIRPQVQRSQLLKASGEVSFLRFSGGPATECPISTNLLTYKSLSSCSGPISPVFVHRSGSFRDPA